MWAFNVKSNVECSRNILTLWSSLVVTDVVWTYMEMIKRQLKHLRPTGAKSDVSDI